MPDKLNPSRIIRSRRADFEARAREDGPPFLSGRFVVFGEPYHMWDDLEEIIMPYALERADMSDVRALCDHFPHLVLGRANDNVQTLTFSIDDKGLNARIDINPDDADAMNLYARVQRGDVDQASFGFDEEDVRYLDLPDGRVQRQIWGISKLWEISVCTFPAYEQTSVSARARVTEELAAHRAAAQAARKAALLRRLKHVKGVNA